MNILLATAMRVVPEERIDSSDPKLAEAAEVFYDKGANPRHLRIALSNAYCLHGRLTPETILFAADDLTISADVTSAIYADLWAIKACSSRSFFPWSDNPEGYLFPDHLQGVVDNKTGTVIYAELERRIKEYEPHANL